MAARLAAEGNQDLAAGEGGGVGRQALGAGQLVEGAGDGRPVDRQLAFGAVGDLGHQPLGLVAVLAGFLLPAAVQGLGCRGSWPAA